ncbi:hypothetical protein BDV29DRAFT_171734 [Aspergillus leporis]|uniref:Uncharacterized protein n=1 Tax=Aspergillus leporis TaxID=41062 RepID=A0A5N5X4J1_9EURO|nr:hypothetical protein BDV29DRAFT_171734 [Aspergillus leporis]
MGVEVTARWQKKQSGPQIDRASLTGSMMLDMAVRAHGPNNTVRLTILRIPAPLRGWLQM